MLIQSVILLNSLHRKIAKGDLLDLFLGQADALLVGLVSLPCRGCISGRLRRIPTILTKDHFLVDSTGLLSRIAILNSMFWIVLELSLRAEEPQVVRGTPK